MVLGIFEITLRLIDQRVFIWQSLEILNVFNTLTLKQDFWKTKGFSNKKLEHRFLLKVLRLKAQHFQNKLLCQKPMLRQIEWEVQNGPITMNDVFLVTILFSWKFYFILRTSYIELIWCTNHPNVHIHTFRKRSSFISGCFFPVSILNSIKAPKNIKKVTVTDGWTWRMSTKMLLMKK